MNNFFSLYKDKIQFNLIKKYNYQNTHLIPKLIKIVLNMGLGLNASNPKYLKTAALELSNICGQFPALTCAKKSIAEFNIKQDMPLGLIVTLRKKKMYTFFEKLIKLALPQIRNFQGLSYLNFDSLGNYSFGINDLSIFPEIDHNFLETKKGFNITINIKSNSILESYSLLQEFGFPFEKI